LITTNNLDSVQVVAAQDNQFQTFNDKVGELDSFLTEALGVSVSAGNASVSSASAAVTPAESVWTYNPVGAAIGGLTSAGLTHAGFTVELVRRALARGKKPTGAVTYETAG
jgi:hypothetical protein